MKVSHINIIFAAEIAEMLSADMQKEGLRGRTLTLKLKTASFEVLLDLYCCLLKKKRSKLSIMILVKVCAHVQFFIS